MQLFMHVKNPRIRKLLAESVRDAFGKVQAEFLKGKVMETVISLNKLKRGLADLELDCDSAI